MNELIDARIAELERLVAEEDDEEADDDGQPVRVSGAMVRTGEGAMLRFGSGGPVVFSA